MGKDLVTIYNEITLKERYRTLSDLWIPNSKHKTHIRISKLMDETLLKLKELDNSEKDLEVPK